MPKINYPHTNFTSGEFSPQLFGRFDIAKYVNGASTLENFIVKSFGGAYRRPGTYFVAEVKDSSKQVRLIPFQFSTIQAYILEFGDQYIRFYKDNGQIESAPNVPYEIVSPYLEADLFELQFAQSADVMYITHPDYAPRKLTRTGHTSWTLSVVNFLRGPFMDDNVTSTTITPSADAGAGITLTASTSIFTADHVGSSWKIKDGWVKITGYTSGTVVTATVQDEPDGTTGNLNTGPAATTDWAEGSWSVERGYPTCVSFYEQRLWFANSTYQPQTLWASQTDDFENFLAGATDTDALVYTLVDNQVNAIRWIIAGRALAVGTVGGGFTITSDPFTGPLSPTNIFIKRETSYGAAALLPKRIGNYVYYMQRNLLTMREFSYNFDSDSFVSLDMTLLSDHITGDGIVDMDYQESPDNILWCVRSDGTLATLTRQIEQKVIGWSRQVTDGLFESVAVIPAGTEDQVWVVVQRTINSVSVRYIEYFKPFSPPNDQEDMFYVDCGLTYDGVAADTITGLDHLEGETVVLLVDGASHPSRTVASGEITLNDEYSVIQVGLPYTPILYTLPMEGGSPMGTSQNVLKRIYKATVRLYRSLGCKVGTDSVQETVYFRSTSDDMDVAPPLFTGDKQVQFPAGYTKSARVYVTSDLPLPLNVLAIIFKAQVAEE